MLLFDRLWAELGTEEKSATYVDLIRLVKEISDHVLRNRKILKKEVAEIMGGRILELESERLHRIGMQQGVEEGIQKGVEEGTINAIVRMIKKDYPKAQILDLGYTEEEYQKAEKQLLIKA